MSDYNAERMKDLTSKELRQQQLPQMSLDLGNNEDVGVITFVNKNNDVIGRLILGDKLDFVGDPSESADIFLDELIRKHEIRCSNKTNNLRPVIYKSIYEITKLWILTHGELDINEDKASRLANKRAVEETAKYSIDGEFVNDIQASTEEWVYNNITNSIMR